MEHGLRVARLPADFEGEYRVKAAALQAPYAEACDLIGRFKTVALVWKRAEEIKPLFGRP